MKTFKIKEIEDEIDLGQIEQVIEMAKDELKLVDYYYGKKKLSTSTTFALNH